MKREYVVMFYTLQPGNAANAHEIQEGDKPPPAADNDKQDNMKVFYSAATYILVPFKWLS